MQKSSSQKALKVISIIMIVFGALTTLLGLFSTIGGGALGVAGYSSLDDNVGLAGGLLMILGFMFLVSGVFQLILGIFGVRGANNPSKIGVFFVLAIIDIVFCVISAIISLTAGMLTDASTILSTLAGFILPVVCLILANNIKKENRL